MMHSTRTLSIMTCNIPTITILKITTVILAILNTSILRFSMTLSINKVYLTILSKMTTSLFEHNDMQCNDYK